MSNGIDPLIRHLASESGSKARCGSPEPCRNGGCGNHGVRIRRLDDVVGALRHREQFASGALPEGGQVRFVPQFVARDAPAVPVATART